LPQQGGLAGLARAKKHDSLEPLAVFAQFVFRETGW
jgi:hypothetical protein